MIAKKKLILLTSIRRDHSTCGWESDHTINGTFSVSLRELKRLQNTGCYHEETDIRSTLDSIVSSAQVATKAPKGEIELKVATDDRYNVIRADKGTHTQCI